MKTRWIIPALMILMIPIAIAILECNQEGIITQTEVPCIIRSTWDYETCDIEVKIYNSTPTLIDTRTMSSFGSTGKCNFTWNYTQTDTYSYNVSNGDTGQITVEVDENMVLASIIGITIFSIGFGAAAIYLWNKKEEVKE